MIPLRYRKKLPPYWYEIDTAEQHFMVMEQEIEEREKKIEEIRNQFLLQRATWALAVWEGIYFQSELSGSIEQRRERIRQKKWAKRPFKLPVLRVLGEQHGNLLRVAEDGKEIRFEFEAGRSINLKKLRQDFEYIRPIHIRQMFPVITVPVEPIIMKYEAHHHAVDFPICGLEMPMR